MHVLPRVRELEGRFADAVSVIGVHAGKFSTERKTDRIVDACARLGVEHAVVNDRQFRVWHDYGVHAWPTIALIAPDGRLVGMQSGEFPLEPMARVVEDIIATAQRAGTLERGPDPTHTTGVGPSPSPLSFPTRAILADDQLWVSDTGNGRVVRCSWFPAERRATITAEYPGFIEPRGLVRWRGATWVADRKAHSIFRIDESGTRRIAGTGELGDFAHGGGNSETTALRSPWGLSVHEERLVVAMAGSHQLWTLDPASQRVEPLAGRGPEDIADGPTDSALLAQPTGVVSTSGGVFFSDCESSAVRVVEDERGRVRTLAGTGLFDFGDRDGVGDEALLQHNEDVAVHGDLVVVADTYNDRLRAVDPATREVSGWVGDAGLPGAFREPGGVFSDGETLLVSDTGNHRIAAVEDDGSLTEVRFT
jgi:sugar lactone lactonase YvrE